MTLRTRNRTLILFIIFSLLCFGSSLACLIFQIHTKAFEQIFGYKFFSLSGFSFIAPSDKSVILALLFIQFYVTICAFFLYFNFEKTQSTLIILFALFLLGCQLQIAKFFIGILNYKMTFSLEYLVLGRASLMGKLITIASFFLIASEAKNSSKLNIEIDIFILLIACLIISLCIPLKTAVPSKNFGITPGYAKVLNTLGLVTVFLTVITFFVSYRETEDKIMLYLLVSYLHLIIGFFIISSTNIFLSGLLGAALLSIGTHQFLKTLHKMYLWD